MCKPTNKTVMGRPKNKKVILSVGIKKDIIRFKIENEKLAKDKKGLKIHIHDFLRKRGHEKVEGCDIARWIKEHKWIREAHEYPRGTQGQIILEKVVMEISRKQTNTRKEKKDDSRETEDQTDSNSEVDDEEGEEKKDDEEKDEYIKVMSLCPPPVSVPEIAQVPISVPQISPPILVPENSVPENSALENSISAISESIPGVLLPVPVPELPLLAQVAQIRLPTPEPEITIIAEIPPPPPVRSSCIKHTSMLSNSDKQGSLLSPSFEDLTIFEEQLATYILEYQATLPDANDDDVIIEKAMIRSLPSFVSMRSSKIQQLRNILDKVIGLREVWWDVQESVQYRKSVYIMTFSNWALMYMNEIRRIVGRNEIPFLEGYYVPPPPTNEISGSSCAMS